MPWRRCIATLQRAYRGSVSHSRRFRLIERRPARIIEIAASIGENGAAPCSPEGVGARPSSSSRAPAETRPLATRAASSAFPSAAPSYPRCDARRCFASRCIEQRWPHGTRRPGHDRQRRRDRRRTGRRKHRCFHRRLDGYRFERSQLSHRHGCRHWVEGHGVERCGERLRSRCPRRGWSSRRRRRLRMRRVWNAHRHRHRAIVVD